MNYEPRNITDFTIIYNRYKTPLYNYVLKITFNKDLCGEIVQNVFVKFYENMGNIRNESSIPFYLFKSARNLIYENFRRRKYTEIPIENNSDFLGPEVSLDPSEAFETEELRELILNELNKLPEEQREVYLLKEYGGLSYKEAASVLEISEELVKSRLYKTRQKLINKITKLI